MSVLRSPSLRAGAWGAALATWSVVVPIATLRAAASEAAARSMGLPDNGWTLGTLQLRLSNWGTLGWTLESTPLPLLALIAAGSGFLLGVILRPLTDRLFVGGVDVGMGAVRWALGGACRSPHALALLVLALVGTAAAGFADRPGAGAEVILLTTAPVLVAFLVPLWSLRRDVAVQPRPTRWFATRAPAWRVIGVWLVLELASWTSALLPECESSWPRSLIEILALEAAFVVILASQARVLLSDGIELWRGSALGALRPSFLRPFVGVVLAGAWWATWFGVPCAAVVTVREWLIPTAAAVLQEAGQRFTPPWLYALRTVQLLQNFGTLMFGPLLTALACLVVARGVVTLERRSNPDSGGNDTP